MELTPQQVREFLEKSLASNNFKDAERIIQAAIDETIARFKSNAAFELQNAGREHISNFVETLATNLSDVQNLNEDIQVLPDNVKYYKNVGNKTVVVVEHEPKGRMISIGNRKYFFALPYVQYYVSLTPGDYKLYITCTKKPLSNFAKDEFFNLPLPNVRSNLVCTGITSELYRSKDFKNLKEKVDFIIGNFWNYSFNSDLCGNCVSYLQNLKLLPAYICEDYVRTREAEYSSFLEALKQYEKLSKENNLFAIAPTTPLRSCPSLIEMLKFRDDETNQNKIKNIVLHSISELGNAIINIFDKLKRENKIDENVSKNLQLTLSKMIVDYHRKLHEILPKTAGTTKVEEEKKILLEQAEKLSKIIREFKADKAGKVKYTYTYDYGPDSLDDKYKYRTWYNDDPYGDADPLA